MSMVPVRGGEIENQVFNAKSQVGVPLRITFAVAGLVDLLVLIVFGVTFGLWWRIDGILSWWSTLIDWMFMPWLLAFIAPWFWSVYNVIKGTFYPRFHNPNWAPPFAQVATTDVGALTWQNADTIMKPDDEDDDDDTPTGIAPLERMIRIEFVETVNGKARVKYVNLPDTDEFRQFARAVIGKAAKFKGDDAFRFMSRKTWESVRDSFLAAQWAIWKNDEHTTKGVDLLASGRAVLRRIAEEEI